jgi:hypothetical protein
LQQHQHHGMFPGGGGGGLQQQHQQHLIPELGGLSPAETQHR